MIGGHLFLYHLCALILAFPGNQFAFVASLFQGFLFGVILLWTSFVIAFLCMFYALYPIAFSLTVYLSFSFSILFSYSILITVFFLSSQRSRSSWEGFGAEDMNSPFMYRLKATNSFALSTRAAIPILGRLINQGEDFGRLQINDTGFMTKASHQ